MTPLRQLDQLLDLRKRDEDQRAAEAALAQQAERDAMRALQELRAQRVQVERALERLRGESIGQVQTVRLLLEQIDQGIRNARAVGALASAALEEKMEALRVARTDREALERVVDSRRRELHATERLVERRLEDETAMQLYRRARAGDR